ncbi:MAG TPA: SWIM zinc finger family protein, partial [Blastocatellia bacterium]|nr:SWIM zinc finger family protein [Blastocatellia bacterium]
MSSARGRIPRAINHKGINTALLLDKLKPMLGALDDSAWEALASRGLLRRAQKDIERKAAVSIAGERAGCLAVTVDKYEVLIPETGPSKATCDCPAAGVCQHILMACLFIKQQASALERPDESQHSVAGKLDDQPQAEPGSNKPASDSAGEVTNATGELLKITVGALRKWAGTKTFRAAVSFLSQNENVLIEEQNTVVVRFPLIQVSCQFVPGGGLDGMIVSGPRNQAKKLAVASVLAYQGRHGMETAPEAIAEQTLAELEGAPRTREEVTHAVEQLLEESIVAGLSHLSLSAAERFSTLAVS